jgi:hypothetical protein
VYNWLSWDRPLLNYVIGILAIITFWFQKIFQQVQGAERFKSKSFKRRESLITKIFKSRLARRNGKGTATDKRSKLPLNLNGQSQRKIRGKIKMRWTVGEKSR